MDTNPIQPTPPTPPTPDIQAIPQEQATMPAAPQVTQSVSAPTANIPSTPNLVLVPVPMWKNPRMYIAAAAAIIIIVAGIFLSKGSGLKGSFDSYDPALDYKIQNFAISQPADGSFEIAYKIDKAASNLFMAITKPAADDLPENDEMVKLIALSDSDLTAGEHKVQISPDDLKSAFSVTGVYRFQVIAYNANDEITDFKTEKRTVTVDKTGIKLSAPIK
ncbi:MAG: hypothetical protein NTX63_02275 [Candidatus Peregrinibacteria bacterium]|nr:hypothetical protein [Candidatus Peregrinibacteria bacterium]